MKLKMTFVAAMVAMASNASAAIYTVSNVASGYGYSDALFQNVDNTLLSGGIVALGYFAGGAPSGDIGQIATTISNFTPTASALAGTYSGSLGGSFAGYVEADSVNGALITTGNPVLGLGLYVFVGNAATLESSTAWALAQVGTIADDVPFEQSYTANPFGAVPVIGSVGSFTGQPWGSGTDDTYQTLKLVAPVPEPSAALLGALGALGLLRRRRI